MWTRSELKSNAKIVLKENFFTAFLMSLVIFIAGGSGGGNSGGRGAGGNEIGSYITSANLFIIGFAVIILVSVYRVLFGFSLEVGGRRFYIKFSEFKDHTGSIRFAFDGENFRGIVRTMFVKAVYQLLWSLLFIIPGIIKYYSYRMVPYILAENPNIDSDRAITLSREMMNGNKLNLFILELSFIGWYILGALALGVGIFFVNTYYDATEAQLYLFLRKKALEENLCTYEELNLKRDFY
jgi:uncharacterized membrane protein